LFHIPKGVKRLIRKPAVRRDWGRVDRAQWGRGQSGPLRPKTLELGINSSIQRGPWVLDGRNECWVRREAYLSASANIVIATTGGLAREGAKPPAWTRANLDAPGGRAELRNLGSTTLDYKKSMADATHPGRGDRHAPDQLGKGRARLLHRRPNMMRNR